VSPRIAGARPGSQYPNRLPGIRLLLVEEAAVRDAADRDGIHLTEEQRLLLAWGATWRSEHPEEWRRLQGVLPQTEPDATDAPPAERLRGTLPPVRVTADQDATVRALAVADGSRNLATTQRLLLRAGLHYRSQNPLAWRRIVARRNPHA
jgi:hypothetical protein